MKGEVGEPLLTWGVFACFGWLDGDPTRAHAVTILGVAIAAGLIASSLAERVSLRGSDGDRATFIDAS
jgi:hypothetical protein